VLGTPKTIDISGHFTGATSYRTSDVAATVTAGVTDAGMLTLTPVAHGTAEVRVTAINSAGEVSDDFSVTVQAPPAFQSGKEESLPDIRIAAATLPASHALADLMTLFEDPDGNNMSMMFETETDDATKVFVVARTYEDPTATPLVDNTTVLNTADARNKYLSAKGKVVNLYARAAGTATITVTVTDEDELETKKTFMVTAIAAANGLPIVTTSPAAPDLPNYSTTRLKLSDGPKKAIDNVAISTHFTDPDFLLATGDLLTFTAKYVATGGDRDAADLADEDIVATAAIVPDTWDGGADKFTVTVTPVKAGGPQDLHARLG
jgi:hypothetical protein